MTKLTDKEVVDLMNYPCAIALARREFCSAVGKIDQAMAQRNPPTPIELRRMEFDAVRRIALAFGIAVEIEI